MSCLHRARVSYNQKVQHWRKNVPESVVTAVSSRIDTSEQYRVSHVHIAKLDEHIADMELGGYAVVSILHTLTDLGDSETLSGESVTVVYARR